MTLHPVYILSSDDPFLKADRSSQIISSIRTKYPDAELMLFTSSDFSQGAAANLTRLENELIDPGLFGGNSIIKIYLDSIEKSATVQVLHLLSRQSRDGLFCIVDMPRVNSSFDKDLKNPAPYDSAFGVKKGGKSLSNAKKAAKVFSYLGSLGAKLEIMYPPAGEELVKWIFMRVSSYDGLGIDTDACQLLALNCEGNLVACDQFLKLAVLNGVNKITLETVSNYIGHNSRYSGYEFVDSVLNARTDRALNILSSIRESENSLMQPLSLILGYFDKCLSAVTALRRDGSLLSGRASYKDKYAFFSSLKILTPASQDAVIFAAKNLPDLHFNFMVRQLSEASVAIKFFDAQKAYSSLQNIAVCVKNINDALRLEDLN